MKANRKPRVTLPRITPAFCRTPAGLIFGTILKRPVYLDSFSVMFETNRIIMATNWPCYDRYTDLIIGLVSSGTLICREHWLRQRSVVSQTLSKGNAGVGVNPDGSENVSPIAVANKHYRSTSSYGIGKTFMLLTRLHFV